MAVKIGNNTFPPTMNRRAANYQFAPGIPVARNGMGEVQLGGGAIVTWTWSYLNKTEFDFLLSLVGTAASKEYSGASGTIILYNDEYEEQPFSHCIVQRPQYKGYSGGFSYRDVTLTVDCLY